MIDGSAPRDRLLRLASNGGGASTEDEHWVSIVVGENGVGKSRALAAIVEALQRAEGRKIRSKHGLEVDLDLSRGDASLLMLGGRARLNPPTALPERFIAVATTPFDKFPASRAKGSRYRYLGLRNTRGQVSSGSAIFRALDNLFLAAVDGSMKRSRTADIFRFLKYDPFLKVEYRWTGSRIPRDSAESVVRWARARATDGGKKLEAALRDDPHLEYDVSRAADMVLARQLRDSEFEDPSVKTFTLRANFAGHTDDYDFFRGVQLLRSFELVRLSSVLLTRSESGQEIDLTRASSGEMSLATMILGIASVIEDDSLIIMDEPEVSLHPAWQEKFVSLLLDSFKAYRGCHFVIATHSPLIASDIPKDSSSVVSLDRRGAGEIEVAQRSSDELLARLFESPGHSNLFIRKKVADTLRLLRDPDRDLSRVNENVAELLRVTDAMEEDDPLKIATSDIAAVAGELA